MGLDTDRTERKIEENSVPNVTGTWGKQTNKKKESINQGKGLKETADYLCLLTTALIPILCGE